MEKQLKLPAAWGDDGLSKFIQLSWENILASFYKLKTEYNLLLEIDSIYISFVNNMLNLPKWYTGFFILRAHSAYRAALSLSMSGQVPESFMLMRGCLENALYGLYVHQSKERYKKWLRRHDNDEALITVRREFRISSLLDSLEEQNESISNIARGLYDRTIDYGAHPNEKAFSASLTRSERLDQIRFDMAYIAGYGDFMELGLKTSAQIGLCSLDIFKIAYKERFDIIGLSDRMDILRQDL